MRPRTFLPALVLVAVVGAAAGCYRTSAAPAVDQGALTRRAADVARSWPGSAREQAWRAEYWPWNLPEQWLPSSGFHNDADQQAFKAGRLTLRTVLPDAPATGEVHWSGGPGLTLPLIPPVQISQHLTAGGPCTSCPAPLAINAIHAGTRQVPTSRGQATIPTWEFTVEGYSEPFVYPAVAATGTGPGLPPVADAHIRGLAVAGRWTATSTDGLTISASVAHGACDRALPGQVYETDQVVVLIGERTEQPGSCIDLLVYSPADFRLSRPLGSRAVLDAATGNAVTVEPPQAGRGPGPAH